MNKELARKFLITQCINANVLFENMSKIVDDLVEHNIDKSIFFDLTITDYDLILQLGRNPKLIADVRKLLTLQTKHF